MGFLFPKAPKPVPPPNPAAAAPTTDEFAPPTMSDSLAYGAGAINYKRKPNLAKSSFIGGG